MDANLKLDFSPSEPGNIICELSMNNEMARLMEKDLVAALELGLLQGHATEGEHSYRFHLVTPTDMEILMRFCLAPIKRSLNVSYQKG